MSDIGINLDGVLAFLAASALGLMFVMGIMIGSLVCLVKARRKHERFSEQRFFPHALGMFASLVCCLIVLLLVISADSMLPPRRLDIWLDHWLWAWSVAVLAFWPVTAYVWKKWQMSLRAATREQT